jgi:hypothetical protein
MMQLGWGGNDHRRKGDGMTLETSTKFQIGCDIGGTFTDVAAIAFASEAQDGLHTQ